MKNFECFVEQVEVCPHCEAENEYANWNPDEKGFIAKCDNCGREIFLCDACMHHWDNPEMRCDWRKEGNVGVCFRGRIVEEA